jgi:hypothetical protein
MEAKYPDVGKEILEKMELSQELENRLKSGVEEFKSSVT